MVKAAIMAIVCKSLSVKLASAGLCGLSISAQPLAAGDLSPLLAAAWTTAEQRSAETVAWLTAAYGTPQLYSNYPSVGNPATGRWNVNSETRFWQNGFWPGTLWLLAQRTGSATWKQRAENWSAPLATSTNNDHDIGFIAVTSFGKGWLYHDEPSDPGAVYRDSAKTGLSAAAVKLNSRFNMPNASGLPVPAGFTRSWNSPFESPYPVCIDNLMNLEVLFLGYELNGRQPAHRPWFDHALAHARSTIAQHLRADGSTYHVVRHFESGPQIGQIERKNTLQGYGDESTWSRGQAWAIYGFTMAYRYAHRDPGTDATDLLTAARAAADYFISHLPHDHTADPYNHRLNDFVPPSDFDAAVGEPSGPWNDADNNYNPSTGTGLGDARPGVLAFTPRDSSAAAVAASGLIELSGYVTSGPDRARYLGAAENILKCLISYDGPDPGTEPDYLCAPSSASHPGILKGGCVRWGDSDLSLIYGDYYFLVALARYETLTARAIMEKTQRSAKVGPVATVEFETSSPAPALTVRIQKSPDLADPGWTTIATRTGTGPWTGPVAEEPLPNGRVNVKITDPAPGPSGFFRILTHSAGGGR